MQHSRSNLHANSRLRRLIEQKSNEFLDFDIGWGNACLVCNGIRTSLASSDEPTVLSKPLSSYSSYMIDQSVKDIALNKTFRSGLKIIKIGISVH
jgi:hypothetical protein